MSFYTPFAFIKEEAVGEPLFLDLFPGAFMAYSLRKLKNSYTGSAVQVIKVDNTTTQDIGFDSNGSLDTAALSSFLGGDSGFVSKWYDQSGNGYDLTRGLATTQPFYGPIIYSSGSTVTINNEPALFYNNVRYGSQVELKVSASFAENTFSTFIVTQVSGSTSNNTNQYGRFISIRGPFQDFESNNSITIFDARVGGLNGISIYQAGAARASIGTYNTTTGFQMLVSAQRSSSAVNIRYNTASLASGSTTTANLSSNTFGVGNNGGYADSGHQGYFQEVIYYKTLQTANSSSIIDNINDYYNIY
jgi:hypothetical protein